MIEIYLLLTFLTWFCFLLTVLCTEQWASFSLMFRSGIEGFWIYMIRFEVTLCGFRDVQIQELSNQPSKKYRRQFVHVEDSRSGELRTQKLKFHPVRTQSLNVLSLAWSRSVYSHTCYAYCQGFLPYLFLHFRSIHLHFFQTSPDFSCVDCG